MLLKDWQTLFFTELLERNSRRSETLLSEVLKRKISETPSFDKETRMEVYGYAFWKRQIESLREDFAKVEKVYGEDAFKDLLRDYIAIYPSEHYSLAELGRKLPQFLREENLAPWIYELSLLEWQMFETGYLPEQPKPSVDDIQNGNFQLKDSVHVFHFSYPVVEIFNSGVEKPKAAQTVVVVRNEIAESFIMDAEAGLILQALKGGETLEGAIAAAGVLSSEKVQQYFQEFMQNGFFTSQVLATP